MIHTTPHRNGTHPDHQAIFVDPPMAPWHYCALCDSPVLAFCDNMGRCAEERRQRERPARRARWVVAALGVTLWAGALGGGWVVLWWVLRRVGVL